jgi:hypothetical protein
MTDLLDQCASARGRAADLVEAAARAVAAASGTRNAIIRDRLRSATRRRYWLRCGSSDDTEERLRKTFSRTCPCCATTDLAALGYGHVTPAGELSVGFRCRRCETRFFYVQTVPHFYRPSKAYQASNRCQHVTITNGSGRPCDECAGLIEPSYLEFRARLADGQTRRFHPRCLSRWYNTTQR